MTTEFSPEWLDAQLEAERHQEALDALNQALTDHPADAALHALRGDLMAACWQHPEAAADWETALSIDPSLTDVRRRLALLEATRPYRLAGREDGAEDWESDLPAGGEEDGEAWEALERQLLEALNSDPAQPAYGSDWPDNDGLPDDGDEDAFFEPQDEDSIRLRGLKRLQSLVDESALDEAGLLDVADALCVQAGLPWHALDVLQRGLAAHPGSIGLQRALAGLWMRLASEAPVIEDEVPAGYSADLTGNLYHPVSAATALQLCDALPEEAWDAGLFEQRARIHRLLGDHAAAAADFARAAAGVESLAGQAGGETDSDLQERLGELRREVTVSRGGDRALIAARQQEMQETMSRLSQLQQTMGEDGEDDEAPLREARAAADEYIDSIGQDPLDDAEYVREVCAQIPHIAEAILDTLEQEPYEHQPLGERELHQRIGEDDAGQYLAQRNAFVNLGFAVVGWHELQTLSRRLQRPAILDLLLSPDQGTVAVVFVLDGKPTLETHTLFSDGTGLSCATLRGRSAGWTPPPFRQIHLPPETAPELLLRLHEGAVRRHAVLTGANVVTLHPGTLAQDLDDWRGRRAEARLAHGFHDAELRGYTREHYRAGGEALRQELKERLARMRPRKH